MQRRCFLQLGLFGAAAALLPTRLFAASDALKLPAELQNNPLLTFDKLPDFAAIRPEHIVPAVDFLLQKSRETVEAVSRQPEISWENFYLPLQDIGAKLDYAWGIADHLNSMASSDELRKAYESAEGKLSEYGSWYGQHHGLYRAFENLRTPAGIYPLFPTRKSGYRTRAARFQTLRRRPADGEEKTVVRHQPPPERVADEVRQQRARFGQALGKNHQRQSRCGRPARACTRRCRRIGQKQGAKRLPLHAGLRPLRRHHDLLPQPQPARRVLPRLRPPRCWRQMGQHAGDQPKFSSCGCKKRGCWATAATPNTRSPPAWPKRRSRFWAFSTA